MASITINISPRFIYLILREIQLIKLDNYQENLKK